MSSKNARENLFSLIEEGHYNLAVVACQNFEATYPLEYGDLKDELSLVYYFYNDTPHEEFNGLMESIYREVYSLDKKEALLERTKDEMAGLELSHVSQNSYIVFMPDPSEKGRFRYSEYNDMGFFSHFTLDSYKELIEEAWQLGYRDECKGKLNELSIKPEWTAGANEVLLIQQYNQGSISFKDLVTEVSHAREHTRSPKM
jgi:hypothetical protein